MARIGERSAVVECAGRGSRGRRCEKGFSHQQTGRPAQRAQDAFTLTWLLLAVGILAVLLFFAVPNRIGSGDHKTKFQLARSAIGPNGRFAEALGRFKFDMGNYPSTVEGLAVLLLPKDRVKDQRYKGPYISDMTVEDLKDPWGNAFRYRSPGEFHRDGYDLWSCRPDGKDDAGRAGSDDVKNWIEK